MNDGEIDIWNKSQRDAMPTYCECDPQPIPDEEHENRCPACGMTIAVSEGGEHG